MLPLKDARILLARLQKLSLVETTEVPKTAAKMRINMPSAAEYHLWSVDLPRVYNSLLSNIYKTIANTIQRRAVEVEKRTTVLEREAKASRKTGASAQGRTLLLAKDQTDLGSLEESVKKLVVGQERSDLVAFILRDLPGWPVK
jgi:DNA-directed RNA polymerase III subunit RPC3